MRRLLAALVNHLRSSSSSSSSEWNNIPVPPVSIRLRLSLSSPFLLLLASAGSPALFLFPFFFFLAPPRLSARPPRRALGRCRGPPALSDRRRDRDGDPVARLTLAVEVINGLMSLFSVAEACSRSAMLDRPVIQYRPELWAH